MTAQQWLQFEEMYGVTLLQMYGMSETGWVCGNRHYAKKMGTVGLPALHQELMIVDAAGNECPPDVEGEITVGGPQMAIGYLLDDGSIDPVLGKRIKTGDLGIKDAEGFVRVIRPQQGPDHPRRRQHRAAWRSTRCCSSIQASPRPPRSACRTRSTAKRWCATWCRRTRR